jgi:phosphinothricin acetyltransferase
MTMSLIRISQPADIAGITAIYEHHVLHGTGTFETTPPTETDMAARREDVLAKGLPYLVIEQDGQVAGFAYCQWFKPRPAYRFSAEDSIYLHPDSAGKGLGKRLLAELERHAEAAGIRKLIAVIGDSGNAGSIGVHRALGFTHAGKIASCGWKFGRWLDIVLMEKAVGGGDTTSPPEGPQP